MANYTIGLTGGVASGKSVVARCFEALGVAVIDADVAAREAVAPGTDGLAAIVEAFGPTALEADGGLDRAAMRRRIFNDDTARRQLEAIVHPRVRAAVHAASERATGPYVIVAIPLLAEGGGRDGYPWLDRILVVDVPVQLQVARLLERDAVDEALANRMVATQADRLARLAIADDVLVNSDTVEALNLHVAALDAQYRALGALAALPGSS
jgi:dephospho-CoA kinase